jgi:hypothetical protein
MAREERHDISKREFSLGSIGTVGEFGRDLDINLKIP